MKAMRYTFHWRLVCASLLVLIALAGILKFPAHSVEPRQPTATSDGDWTAPAKDNANTRFSALEQISRNNVAQLRVSFAFATGVLRGHESAPIVGGGTMYIVTPYPNILYALDLTKPGAPVKWKYEPHPSSSSQGAA